MNIGIFTDTYEPEINGVVTSIKTLKCQLEAKGHNVYVFTTSHPKADKNEKNIYRLPSMPFLFSPRHRVATLYSHKCYKEIKKLNLDIIHNQTEFSLGIFGKLIAKKLNIPMVHTYHTMWEDYTHYITRRKNSKLAPRAFNKISQVFCDKFDTIIAPTEKTKKALLRYKVSKPIEVIPTGIDLTPFNKSNFSDDEINTLKNTYGIKSEDKVIVFVGRIAHEKSIDVIIEQLPSLSTKISNVKFLVVGDGPAKLKLEFLTKKLNLSKQVIFAGKQPWDTIGKFYALGDVFVSASTSETQGLTFLESMASGTPVVAKYDTNLDGVINDSINGKFFYNDSELSDVIYDILSDDSFADTMSDNALKTANDFSANKFGNTVENLYDRVISNFKN